MHDLTRLGWVHLTVGDLERSLSFYEGTLGLHPVWRGPGCVAVGVRDEAGGPRALALLSHQPGARPKPPGCRGLYHFALLLPTRRQLAEVVARVVRSGWPIDGASDHWVSEAVYLSDPDGHGIELYADRPRDEWPRRGDHILMTTEPLDFDGLMAELAPGEDPGGVMPAGTRLGHIHLQVSRVARAERFYRDALGLDLVLRFGPSARFFAAGGYHHHVGANTWAGVDAPPPPPDCVQLRHFSFVVPSADDVQAVARRLEQAGVEREPLDRLEDAVLQVATLSGASTQAGFVTRDEDGHTIAVVSEGNP